VKGIEPSFRISYIEDILSSNEGDKEHIITTGTIFIYKSSYKPFPRQSEQQISKLVPNGVLEQWGSVFENRKRRFLPIWAHGILLLSPIIFSFPPIR
jgi:hypothetical protein